MNYFIGISILFIAFVVFSIRASAYEKAIMFAIRSGKVVTLTECFGREPTLIAKMVISSLCNEKYVRKGVGLKSNPEYRITKRGEEYADKIWKLQNR